jgi:hypothetical protein
MTILMSIRKKISIYNIGNEYVYVFLSISKDTFSQTHASVTLSISIYLSIYLSIYHSIYRSIYIYIYMNIVKYI